jgi:alpha-1,2-mannosyltransferase
MSDVQLLDQVETLAQERGVADRVDFRKNVGWDELRRLLGHSAVGLHTMWCEHFGIGVVQMMVRPSHQCPSLSVVRQSRWALAMPFERNGPVTLFFLAQAAGLVTIAHNSGGPKTDIVEHQHTGYLAATEAEYAECMERALVIKNEHPDEHTNMQRRARLSAQRFSDEVFAEQFAACLVPLCL